MKALVCGGRNWRSWGSVWRVLTQLSPTMVIQGGCPTGADKFAREWATENGVDLLTFEADWDTHGRAAGPIRNGVMLKQSTPDVVVAFPGGAGTADMVRRAKAAGVKVIEPVDTGGDAT